MNKDVILEYCKNYQTNDMDSLQMIKDVELALTNPDRKHYLLSSCPSSCGLVSFVGDCEGDDDDLIQMVYDCEKCWERALND